MDGSKSEILAVKEVSNATIQGKGDSRRRNGIRRTVRLNNLWNALPEHTRQQTLQTLANVVTRIALTPSEKEVTRESR